MKKHKLQDKENCDCTGYGDKCSDCIMRAINEYDKFKESWEDNKNKVDYGDMNESIEWAIMEDGYKPNGKEVMEMAIKIKFLKKQIDMFIALCNELEEDKYEM